MHNIYGSDIYELAASGHAYPVADVSGEELALGMIGGEHDVKQDPYTLMQAMKHGDIYLSSGRGGGGLGDPLLRSDESMRRTSRAVTSSASRFGEGRRRRGAATWCGGGG